MSRPHEPHRHAVVTGGTGHLGTNLALRLLDHGWSVTVLGVEPLSREMPDLDHQPIRRVQLGLTDPDALARAFDGADAVFHLAGIVSILERDADAMWSVNVGGTANVIAAARAAGVGRLVHYSSAVALQPDPNGILHEGRPLVDDPAAPTYDRTKAAAEHLVLDAVTQGLDAVIVNPAGVFGPFDRGPSAMGGMLLDVWTERLLATVSGGFSWVDTRDVADGAIAAADRGCTGERYLLGGNWASLTEMVGLAAGIGGVRPPRFEVPASVARLVAPAAARWSAWRGTPPQFTPASVRTLQCYPVVSIERARRRELGYAPRPLSESLTDLHRWFRTIGLLAPVELPAALRDESISV